MALRRGFKTETNDIAREVRDELGLAAEDPLDPWKLARHLAIPVTPLSALAEEAPHGVRHFQLVDSSRFSAVTVFVGSNRFIIHNDAHAQGRQASDVGHELAHGLLLHPPVPALDSTGCRNWDGVVEEEANWLAGALLVSEEAAVVLARQGTPVAEAAAIYGVSEKLMDWRLNVTGARIRAARRAQRLASRRRTP
jgi:Zn-dependent peptidase ImmA (M78 family)